MPYLSDRQRVELAIPARILHSVIQSATEDESDAKTKRLTDLIFRACNEPLDDLRGQDKLKLARRIDRVYAEIMEPHTTTETRFVSAGKAGLIAFYFMRELIERDILVLYDGTPMAVALEAIMVVLDPVAKEEAVDRSAEKQGRKLLEKLQSMGYYSQ